MSNSFAVSDVAKHAKEGESMYIIIDDGVYDITEFISEHPGGEKILKRAAGKDATKQFWRYHNEDVLKQYGEKLRIGTVKEKPKL